MKTQDPYAARLLLSIYTRVTCDAPCLFPLPSLASIFSLCFQLDSGRRTLVRPGRYALWASLSTEPLYHAFLATRRHPLPTMRIASVKLSSLDPRVPPPSTANANSPFVPGNPSIPADAERDSAFKTSAADPYRNPDVCCSMFFPLAHFHIRLLQGSIVCKVRAFHLRSYMYF